MNTVYKDKSKCCGCKNCKIACPKNAIKIVNDEYGFEYPDIDQNLCIDCGRCQTVCPMINVKGNPIESAFAVVLNDEAKNRSASGGAFYALAKTFIEEGGVVFGCAFDNDLKAVHIQVDSISELSRLQGSKYVQSDMECQKKILGFLKNGKKVLFSGTPCQVSAIIKIAGNYTENLYTIELVCHGVPNSLLWKEYKTFLEKKRRGRIVEFNFRSKAANKPWYSNYIVFSNNKYTNYSMPSVLSSYYYSFLKGKIYRKSCYSCPFAKAERQSDITICDYWGYTGVKFREHCGLSAVLIQGEKGKQLYSKGCRYLDVEETTFELVSKQNEQLKRPTNIEKYDVDFLQLWKDGGINAIERRQIHQHWKAYIAHLLKLI